MTQKQSVVVVMSQVPTQAQITFPVQFAETVATIYRDKLPEAGHCDVFQEAKRPVAIPLPPNTAGGKQPS